VRIATAVIVLCMAGALLAGCAGRKSVAGPRLELKPLAQAAATKRPGTDPADRMRGAIDVLKKRLKNKPAAKQPANPSTTVADFASQPEPVGTSGTWSATLKTEILPMSGDSIASSATPAARSVETRTPIRAEGIPAGGPVAFAAAMIAVVLGLALYGFSHRKH
jgi:hypothetical protein